MKLFRDSGQHAVIRMSLIISVMFCCSLSKPSKVFFLPDTDCNTYYSHVDGAAIMGQGSLGFTGPCNITIATGSSEPWMIGALDMSLNNCEVRIDIFGVESGITTREPLIKYTCFVRFISPFVTNHSVVTILLHHNNRTNYHFKLVLTATKSRYGCEDFVCDSGVCISKALTCDGVDNCFDFSDERETEPSHCVDYNLFRGENFGVLVSVVGGSIFVGLLMICCKKIRKRRRKLHEDSILELANGPYITKYACVYTFVRPSTSKQKKRSRLKRFSESIPVDEPEF